jgi:hypothetical protein
MFTSRVFSTNHIEILGSGSDILKGTVIIVTVEGGLQVGEFMLIEGDEVE